MNRAQRRNLKRVVAHAIKGKPGLSHPVPDSVVLSGGPMDGWIVNPEAPALEADWRAKYLEAAAEGEYLKGLERLPYEEQLLAHPWDLVPASVREAMLDWARETNGAGRYQLAPGGKTAAWVAE